MIVKLYKSNVTLGIIITPVIVILLCLPLLFNEITFETYHFSWQKHIFNSILNIPILNFSLTVIILILNSILISQSFNKTVFFSKTTYLPSILYLVIISFSTTIQFSPTLLVHLFTILLFNQIQKINTNDSLTDIVFKGGLLIGLMATINLIYSTYFLVLIIALFTFQSFKIKELLGSLLGFSIPLIYLFSSQYIFNNKTFDFGTFSVTLNSLNPLQLIDYFQIFCFSLITIVGLKLTINFNRFNSIFLRKQIFILFSAIIISFITISFNFLYLNTVDFLFIVPLTFILSISSHSAKNDTFISFLISLSLIVNIASLFIT